MKKRVILFVAFAASAFVAFAQNEVGRFSIIPRLGVSIANMSNNSVYVASGADDNSNELKSRSKAGLLAGFDVDYQATPQVSVSLGLMYSLQGRLSVSRLRGELIHRYPRLGYRPSLSQRAAYAQLLRCPRLRA